ELDEDDYADIDASMADFEETADSMNYSLSAYLRRFFHKGLTPALLEEIVKEQTIATKVSEVKTAEYAASYSDAKIDETYFKSLETYGVLSLRYFDIAAEKETVKAKEEGKEDTQEVTDKTMAAAKAKADSFVAALSGADFKDVAADFAKQAGDEKYEDYKTDDTKTLMEDVTHGDVSYESSDKDFLKWAIDTDTKAGETYVVKNEGTGYTVFMMVTPVHKAADAYTYDVRHILVKFPEEETDSAEETEEKEEVKVEELDTSKYDVTVENAVKTDKYTNAELYNKAQSILKEYLDGAKTEEFFGELAAKYSEDGNAAEGGFYEGVTEGYMVAEFEN
ncbi:MAG: peptidylprolyl isomerase, partial [Clostridia bacterium]|nr:peptidylprolyl isomerase [Clostridia bacterium]